MEKSTGHRFRLARERAGLSVQELADQAGVNPQTVRNVEAGRLGVVSKLLLQVRVLGGKVRVSFPQSAG